MVCPVIEACMESEAAWDSQVDDLIHLFSEKKTSMFEVRKEAGNLSVCKCPEKASGYVDLFSTSNYSYHFK